MSKSAMRSSSAGLNVAGSSKGTNKESSMMKSSSNVYSTTNGMGSGKKGGTSQGSLKPLASSKTIYGKTTSKIQEKQGLTDWSHMGIKMKHRGEIQREEAWRDWMSRVSAADAALEMQDILPIVKVERHPVYRWYQTRLQFENDQSNERTKSRLLMKRFVFDVQEIWLSNLEHLKEHRPENICTSTKVGMDNTYEPDDVENDDNFQRGVGLPHRRDIKEIKNLQHQVQSVSQKKALSNAYHTARLPPVTVKLDYVAQATPRLQEAKPLLSELEQIISPICLYFDSDRRRYIFSDKSLVHEYGIIAFQIDRLIPSLDYDATVKEVFWRFTLLHINTLQKRVYFASETAIALYIAETIQTQALQYLQQQLVYSTQQQTKLDGNGEPCPLPPLSIPFEDESVEWKGHFDFLVTQTTTVQQSNTNNLGHEYPVKIIINAYLTPFHQLEGERDNNEENLAVYLQCTPCEIAFLLHRNTTLLTPNFDYNYWIDSQRALDTWPLILPYLRLEVDAMDGGNYEGSRQRIPIGLVLSDKHRQAPKYKIIEGSLTTLQSISCAYELLSLIQITTPQQTSLFEEDEEDSLAQERRQKQLIPLLSLFQLTPNANLKQGHQSLNLLQEILFQASEEEETVAKSNVRGGRSIDEISTISNLTGSYVEEEEEEEEEESVVKVSSFPKYLTEYDFQKHQQFLPPMNVPTNNANTLRPITPGGRFATAKSPSVHWKTEAHYFFHTGQWEGLAYQGYTTSLQSFHHSILYKLHEVPGVTELGKRGLWFKDQLFPHLNLTQVAGHFFRDKEWSTLNSVLCNTVVGIDIALKWQPFISWEDKPIKPPPCVSDDIPSIVPNYSIYPRKLMSEPLRSFIQDRINNTIIIFSTVPTKGIDYLTETEMLYVKCEGFKRYVPIKNMNGFREQIETRLLNIDPVLDPVVYGITKTGAIPNELGVNTRNIWHNSVAVTEHINRPRNAKDYQYIINATTDHGPNVPTSFTTRMKAQEMVGLTSSAFREYEEKYASIKELRDVFNKQLALDAKIKKVEEDYKIKQELKRKQLQRLVQRQLEKKLNKASKSETGWRRRFQYSTLIELQGNWERRRDDRTGLFFFHELVPHNPNSIYRKERFEKTCQWEIPLAWDGDLWNRDNSSFHSNDMASNASANSVNNLDTYHQKKSDFNPTLRKQVAAGIYDDSVSVIRGDSVAENAMQLRDGKQKKSQTDDAFGEPDDTWVPQDTNKNKVPELMTGAIGRRNSMQSIGSGTINTAFAEKSLEESMAATIDTANLEHIAEQLVSSDELMRVLARRLGLPANQVVPADDLSSVFSVYSTSKKGKVEAIDMNNPPLAPREQYDKIETENPDEEFYSDEDIWSEVDDEIGNMNAETELPPDEELPQNQMESTALRRAELREQRGEMKNQYEIDAMATRIPYLNLETITKESHNAKIEKHLEFYGWRRLPRPVLTSKFLTDALKTHTKGPDVTSCNTINAPVFLTVISPIDACKYVPEPFPAATESLFIPDVKKDMERAIATLERNIRREEELAKNMATDDLYLFGEAKEFTSVDTFLARQYKADQQAVADPKELAKENAMLAAKATNIAMMEDALAEDIPINTADEFGNTLLILAAQTGSKRMCKFLLRRGANINLQNLTGNTALHYCYAYAFYKLGEYLRSKGADDSILNVDGLTCYEGLSKESMNKTYADYGDEDFVGVNGGDGAGSGGEDDDYEDED